MVGNEAPTPYPELNTVLGELNHRVSTVLRDECVGIYLQGSFALGDFDVHSDVDFVVTTKTEIDAELADRLTDMHDELYEHPSEWAKHLEGSYFPLDILRDHARSGVVLWYLDHGSRALERSAHCNTGIVRWVTRHHGIVLRGPPPDTLVDPIPAEVLRREIAGTIRGWGRQILADPDVYRNRFYQGFITLNYCRMLHDQMAGRPGSKRTGAEWAKQHLGPEWEDLIDRAWDCRPDPAWQVREPANAADYARTLELVEVVVALSERHLETIEPQ